MLRNLLYNCCPHVDAEEAWMDNIRQLKRYAKAFNHKIIINIKTGPDMENPRFVRKCFKGLEATSADVEFVLVPNDPELHELAGFLEGLEKLKSTRDDEITFYAHTKGVRKAVVECSAFEQTSVRQWRNRMYHECLSDVSKIEKTFNKSVVLPRTKVSAAGCFICRGQYGWHFAGTYYWFRHSSLFGRNWRNIPSTRFGPEEYVAVQFSSGELHCLRKVKDLTNITFYNEVSATYRCSACGSFEAVVQDKVICPKCRRSTSFVEKINEMGF